MFSCITCKPAAKERDEENERRQSATPPRPKEPSNSITNKLKGLALKVTGSKRQSKAITIRQGSSTRYHRGLPPESETTESEHNIPSYVGGGSAGSTPPPAAAAAAWDISQAYGYEHYPAAVATENYESSTFGGFDAVPIPITPRASATDDWGEEQVVEDEYAPHEWMAHIEEGISIAFVSLPDGGNDLKKIRFNQDMFDRDLAQRWWVANYERIKELYNVQSINGEAFVPPTLGTSDENEQGESSRRSRLTFGGEGGSGSWVNQALDAGAGGSSSAAGGGQPVTLTPSNSFRLEPDDEAEWVEQDEPGVFITIKKNADGRREIRRLRFSRRRFEVDDAKTWWSQNKERVEAQYL